MRDCFGRAVGDDQHGADLVAHAAAEQFPDRRLEVLALDVPQGLVDGGDGAADGHAAHRQGAVEREIVVLDAERVLTDKALAHGCRDERGGIGEAEEGGFTDAFEAGVGRHFDEHPVMGEIGIDTLDLHFAASGRGYSNIGVRRTLGGPMSSRISPLSRGEVK